MVSSCCEFQLTLKHGTFQKPDTTASLCTSSGLVPAMGFLTLSHTHSHLHIHTHKCDGRRISVDSYRTQHEVLGNDNAGLTKH